MVEEKRPLAVRFKELAHQGELTSTKPEAVTSPTINFLDQEDETGLPFYLLSESALWDRLVVRRKQGQEIVVFAAKKK